MYLTQLVVQQLRCLHEVNLELDPRLNVLIGTNGAGKTSLLEAVYLLSRGQSFRSSQSRKLISDDADRCLVRALCMNNDGQRLNLAIQKTLDSTELRLGQMTQVRMSDLARTCPVLILEPGQHRLVEDGPVLRRRFLDWSVFHVEHGYHAAWQRFSRALKQRNAILRSSQLTALEAWTNEYVLAAQALESLRSKVFQDLLQTIKQQLGQFLDFDIEITYRRGWARDSELKNLLHAQLAQDKERGFTQSGPQRAEIRVTINGKAAKDVLSRGQQKMLITAMMLGQAEHFRQSLKVAPILLVDDLASELGEKARQTLFRVLTEYPGQCFVTSLDSAGLDKNLRDKGKMFHVKHGTIKAML